MNRCKCIQPCTVVENGFEFSTNQFYDFEYVPTGGNNLPFYRVFYGPNQAENFSYTKFSNFFQKY